jgi:hypothetical protein
MTPQSCHWICTLHLRRPIPCLSTSWTHRCHHRNKRRRNGPLACSNLILNARPNRRLGHHGWTSQTPRHLLRATLYSHFPCTPISNSTLEQEESRPIQDRCTSAYGTILFMRSQRGGLSLLWSIHVESMLGCLSVCLFRGRWRRMRTRRRSQTHIHLLSPSTSNLNVKHLPLPQCHPFLLP